MLASRVALAVLPGPAIEGATPAPCARSLQDLCVAKQLLRSDDSTGWARGVIRPHLDLPLWHLWVSWIHLGASYLFNFFLLLSFL